MEMAGGMNSALRSKLLGITAASCFLTFPLHAFTPVFTKIDPPGGTLGSEVRVNFHGERLDGIDTALFYEPGITLAGLEVKDAKTATARLVIAADAPLGEHSLRLAGPGGVSELRSFWVGAFPVVPESEPNSLTGNPQRVDFNRTVQGVAGNEDDDCYIVTLKKGQRLSAEVEAMRLGRTMFDASLAILDAKGFELATCDDAPLLRTDAFVSIIAPEDGDYRIVVHEAAYEGSDECQYRLHIGGFPRPRAVFPTSGKPGETLEFTFIGDPSGPLRQTFTLPAEPRADFPLFPTHDGQTAPSPHWITVSPLASARDNDASSDKKTPVVLPPLPCAAQGILEAGKPSDWFRFTAAKGRALSIRVIARAHRSPLDAVLSLHGTDGKFIIANDDQGSPDSILPWTCPADGDYLLQIRDQLRNTGADFTYRIEITDKTPAISATLPTVERANTQKWKTFPVPRGNRYAAVINVTRENTGCDATFEAASLPAGVKMHAPRIPKSVTSFPVVFEAAAEASVGAGLHAFRICGEGNDLSGPLADTIHHVEINNEGAYHSASFDRIATAVTREAPFHIELDTPPVPIVKNGTLALKVRAVRQQGYAGKINVRFLWNPPGISGPVSVEIPADKTEALYELNAAADAATGDWQICMLAEADTPQGPVLTSSALVPLKVAEPYLAMTLELAASDPGKTGAMSCKIEQLRPFTGNAKAVLTGLPQGVTSPPQEFTASQTEITFPLQITDTTRTGKHSGLFCVVSVPENGAMVLHQAAMGGTLRIDPPVTKTAQSETPAPVAQTPATPAAEKPLSRLEQLRRMKK
jgi:hypothetical protein